MNGAPYWRRAPTLGLALAIGSLLLLVLLATHVSGQTPLAALDLRLATRLHERATPETTAWWKAVTVAGSTPAITLLGVCVAAVLAFERRFAHLAGWVAAVVGAHVVLTLLKNAIQRPRPVYAAALIDDASWSFPSGHAMESLVAYGMLTYLVA